MNQAAVAQQANKVVAPINNAMPKPAAPKIGLLDSAKQSASSSNMFAKFSWVIVVFVLFVIILRITILLLSLIFNMTKSPHIIDGMVSGREPLVFKQDPSSLNAKTIPVSNNQVGGIGFSWSVWVYINNIGGGSSLNTIFTKGDGLPPDDDGPSLSNGPGLYLSNTSNQIVVVMDTLNQPKNEIIINNIPLNKWLHIVIRCTGNVLDVYVNGMIANSKTFTDTVPKQNFGDVNIGTNKGFDGYVSNLWYYNHSLSSMEIQGLLASGPKTTLAKPSAQSSITSTDFNYLSTQWYL